MNQTAQAIKFKVGDQEIEVTRDQASQLYRLGRPWYDHPIAQAGAHGLTLLTSVGLSLLLTKKILIGD